MELLPSDDLETRLLYEERQYQKKRQWHYDTQEKINFVLENKWLKNQEKAKIWYHVGTLIVKHVEIYISNTPVEDFIENILGPFHLQYNINWRLKINGKEDDPVFIYEDADVIFSDISFHIKEGEFKQCRVEKVLLKPDIKVIEKYEMKLICE